MDEEFEGYVTATPYTHVYYPETAPARLQLAAFNRSVAFPSSRPLRYLELGYGNGVSLAINAAAGPGEYWGVDINPAHAAHAQALAAVSGAAPKILNASFEQLLSRPDLPQFDVIVALGVWSWVSDANRRIILELLRRHLREGGLFCMSTLALPGFGELAPLQRLLRLNVKSGGATGGIFDRLDAGLGLASALQSSGSRFLSRESRAGRMLTSMTSADRAYLVHEFLHEHWKPALFADTAGDLHAVGLHFVGSTSLQHHFDELNFQPAALALLAAIDDPWLRETARDFLGDGHLRSDIFIRSDSGDRPERKAASDLELGFVLGLPPSLVKQGRAKMAAVRLEFGAPPFADILEALGDRPCRPWSLEELVALEGLSRSTKEEILRALLVLVDAGIVHPAQPKARIEQAAAACARLNAEILHRAVTEDRIRALASAVTGGGVSVSRIEQLFLLAYKQGARTPDAWARFAWDTLAESAVDKPPVADILVEALSFLQRLPHLVALKLIDEA